MKERGLGLKRQDWAVHLQTQCEETCDELNQVSLGCNDGTTEIRLIVVSVIQRMVSRGTELGRRVKGVVFI